MIGRLATKRIGLPRAVALATCVCTGILLSFSPVTGQEKALKKLYISSISADGVSAPLAKKARERLEFALYEHFGKEYRVLTDEDVKVMFKKAEEIMSTGCSAESCQQQMADAVDADEIIYGELSAEGAALKLSARTLLRDRKTLSVTKKSMVMLGFAEKDLDHYCGEAARKLVNPAYAVQKPPKAAFEEKISLSAVKVEAVKGLDIGVLKFTADDETIQNMLGYLKNLVQEGDDAFGKKKYDDALGKYTTVLDKVKTKLTAEKQAKMADFKAGVVKRCDAAYAMKYKVAIESLDAELTKGGSADVSAMRALRGRYSAIEMEVADLPGDLKGEGMAEISATLSKRFDGVSAAIAVLYEKKGDAGYGEYNFNDAYNYYQAASNCVHMIRDAAMRNELRARYVGKEKAARETGQNYVLSRVRALADRAEFFNLQENASEAKKALKEARKLLDGPLGTFTTTAVVERYNSVAKLLGVKELSKEKDKELFEAIRVHAVYMEDLRKYEDELEGERILIEISRDFKAKGGGKEKTVGGIEFVYIPGGSFMMGSPEGVGAGDERPRHKVTLDGFWMSKYEIKQPQYMGVMGKMPPQDERDWYPVDSISWNDAVEFCGRFNEKYKAKVRLPTEAEWEYACRAGTTTRYYWGNIVNDEYCAYKGKPGWKLLSGGRKPNAWGLHEMSGNLAEWCSDYFDAGYYKMSPEKNPTGPREGKNRVARGGSWAWDGHSVSSMYRLSFPPDEKGNLLGIRLVMPD
ncbi:MAG: formylglycine-generating enzyme family protein [Spirochaetota bacterium]